MFLPASTEALSCVRYVYNRTGGVAPLVNAEFYSSFVRTTPAVGAVAIFYYPSSGLSHVAYVEELSENGFWISEANFHMDGKVGWRFIRWDANNRLVAFWSPPNQSVLPKVEFAVSPPKPLFSLATSFLGTPSQN